MSEFTETPVAEPLDAVQSVPAEAATATAGALLRQARERAGLHLGILSVALKVPVRQLMALEADDHSSMSGPVFVRALAGSVCRHLKIDAAPILALLPQATLRPQVMPPSLESARPEFWRHSSGNRVVASRKLLLLVAFMLALIALIVWLPEWPTGAKATDIAQPQAVAPEPVTPANPMVVLLPSESSMDSASGSPVPAAKAAAPAASLAVPPFPAVGAPLELVFKGKGDDAWVEVQDRTGNVVFSKLVKSGETHVVKGAPVLTVVVGLADAVDVLVRGQPLDLTPFSRGVVARFEVK